MQDINHKRQEINSIIADILNRNDDRKQKQMKDSLDSIKARITEVLKVFKNEVEKKHEKNMLSFQI